MTVCQFLLEGEIFDRRQELSAQSLVQGHFTRLGSPTNQMTRALHQCELFRSLRHHFFLRFQVLKELVQLFGRILAIAMQTSNKFCTRSKPFCNSFLDDSTVAVILFKTHIAKARFLLCASGFVVESLHKIFKGASRIVHRAIINDQNYRAVPDFVWNLLQDRRKSRRDVIGGNKNKEINRHQSRECHNDLWTTEAILQGLPSAEFSP